MAVGTGFGQLFRGIGQVGGVAISSALFQSILARELHKRVHTPDAEEVRSIRFTLTPGTCNATDTRLLQVDQQDPALFDTRRTAPAAPPARGARLVRDQPACGVHLRRRRHARGLYRSSAGTPPFPSLSMYNVPHLC